MVLKPIVVAAPATAKPKSDAGTGVPCDPLPLYEAMRRTALLVLERYPKSPIFRVDFGEESEVVSKEFIAHLPADYRSVFDCRTCKHFLKHWGGLATVDPDTGSLTPFFWNASPPGISGAPVIPPFYRDAIEAVSMLFVGKKVGHEFKVTEETKSIGHAEAGGYMHMHFEFLSEKLEPKPMPGFSPPDTPTLVNMLGRILEDYDLHTVRQAAHLLLDDKLPYADKHKGAMRYLRDLMESGTLARRTADDVAHHNLLHHHAAGAFLGCLHALRTGAVSSLLLWIKQGLTFNAIRDAWDEIAGPAKYMRPSAAPSSGNIASAEKLFADLGITKADLEREFLTPDRIPKNGFVWQSPTPKTAESSGLFSQIVPKPSAKTGAAKDLMSDVPPTPISFAKFATTVLPKAGKVEYLLPKTAFAYFFITGRPGTRPLMQWHDEANLASWYTFVRLTPYQVSQYDLKPGWTPVPQIISFPHMWNDHPASHYYSSSTDSTEQKQFKHSSHGVRYLICLDGIHDKTLTKGWMLFPSLMKREFHGVRSTIEAFSNANSIAKCATPIGGVEVAKKTGTMEHVVRVTSARGSVDSYKIMLFE